MSVRNRILEKSYQLFSHYGISSISLENISSDLGISKRTFYQYFDSKQELVKTIVSNQIETERANLQTLKMCDYNAVVEALKICELSVRHEQGRNAIFLRNLEKHYPDVWEVYDNFIHAYVECFLTENIRLGISENYYWPDSDEKLMAHLWLKVYYMDKGHPDTNAAVQHHFIRGLLNARGISEYLFWI